MSGIQRPVILVDDSPDDLVFLRRRLDKAGVRNPVVTFVSSEDALAYLQAAAHTIKTHPDLAPCVMFTDVKMPRVNGFELLEFVRSHDELRDLKVVMISTSENPKDKALAAVLGATRYVVKFPTPAALAVIVEMACKR